MTDLENTCEHDWKRINEQGPNTDYECTKCGKYEFNGPCAEGHDFEEDMGGNLRCKNCGYCR